MASPYQVSISSSRFGEDWIVRKRTTCVGKLKDKKIGHDTQIITNLEESTTTLKMDGASPQTTGFENYTIMVYNSRIGQEALLVDG